MPLFSSTKESECMLVFDIGSGSVGAAIILVSAARPVRVLYNFRSDIPFQEEADGTRLLSLMLRALSQTVLALSHEGFAESGMGGHPPRIAEAIVSLSAPWIVSKTLFLRLKNKAPTLISAKIVGSLIEHAKSGRESESGTPRGGIPVEQKLVKSVLNGYETVNPYGREALEAEFAIFESFAIPRLTEKVADTIMHLMQPRHISFHSFSLTAFAVLRELYPSEEHFIFADISGEQTELCIVKNAIIVESATFPFGRNHVIRALKRATRMPPSGIETFFKLYNDERGTGQFFERAKRALARVQDDWGAEFQRVLTAFSEELFLPSSVYLMADADLAPILGRAAQTRDTSRFTLSQTSFRVTCVGNEALAPAVSWNPSHSADPFIGIIAAFVNQIRR